MVSEVTVEGSGGDEGMGVRWKGDARPRGCAAVEY